MFLAVDGYKKTKSWLFVILPVMVFILCGFEHCVANMFYFCAADCWSTKTVLYVLVMILGNGVGAIIYKNIPREKK
jgi:formate/nitrite transporter FocA (FNT family)